MACRTDNIGFGNYVILQDPEHFCYGVDAVLLADFTARNANHFSNAADLGTGNGIIPLILAYKNRSAKITGIDILERNISLARKTAEINGLDERLSFETVDVKNASDELGKGKFQVITCNPPYFARGGGITGKSDAKHIARQETTAVIDDFIREASVLLEPKGHLFMIHRPSRLVDIMVSCREHALEPKQMRFVSPREGEIPNMVLLHCIKGGGRELRLMPTLCVHTMDGGYTSEILDIYERN